MAGIKAYLPTGEISLSAANAKTVAMITAPSNHRLLLIGIGVYVKGTVPGDTPIRCRIYRATTAGTSTSQTPTKADNTIDETLQMTGAKNFSVEPTVGDVLKDFYIHPQGGVNFSYLLDSPIIVPGGTRCALEMTAAQAQTIISELEIEE